MELWKILASDSVEKQRILNFYFDLREEFKRLNFSEEDLEAPPTYSNKMWHLRSLIEKNMESLLKKITDYGFEIGKNEFTDYLKDDFEKINKLTPLSDGNKKRDNFGDQDNQ